MNARSSLTALSHTHKPGRQSEAVSAQSRGIMAASRDKGGFQGSLYLQKHCKFSDLFRRAHTGEAKVPASRMKGMLLLQPNLNVCPLFAALSCPTAAVWSPVLVLHRGNELLRVAAPVRLCGRQAESEFYREDAKNLKIPHGNIRFL